MYFFSSTIELNNWRLLSSSVMIDPNLSRGAVCNIGIRGCNGGISEGSFMRLTVHERYFPVLCGERVSDFTAYLCVCVKKRDGNEVKEDKDGLIKCYRVLLQYSHYLFSQEQMCGNSWQSPTKKPACKNQQHHRSFWRLSCKRGPDSAPCSCRQAFVVGRRNLFTAKHQLAGKLTTNT